MVHVSQLHEIDRVKRLLNMSINALIGYLIVEINVILARFLGIISMQYSGIFLLASIVNGGTIAFIIILSNIRQLSKRGARIFFMGEFLLYLSMYTVGLIELNELRLIGLVFALVAITIELPYTDYKESLIISIGSAVMQVVASYYATYYLKQKGSFLEDLFYTISFLPILIIISYVAHQITEQKNKIISDKKSLENMNSRLVDINTALERTNMMAQQEIDLAAHVQKLLLPHIPDDIEGWDIAISFRPKYGVSGDFYDFYLKQNLLRGMAIFDVSGHGVSSSLITIIVKPITYRIFNRLEGSSLSDIIFRVNQNVSAEISLLEHFISAILLRFNGNTVEYVNAGHPDLLFRNGETGTVRVIEAVSEYGRGGPIGIRLDEYKPAYTQFSIGKRDVLLLYTDCIVESKNRNKERYGFTRLISSLQDAPDGTSQDILSYILDKFSIFMEDEELRDDFTVIVLQKTK
jgi:serine phosphatase RsbU (regulator of sigma subunit)